MLRIRCNETEIIPVISEQASYVSYRDKEMASFEIPFVPVIRRNNRSLETVQKSNIRRSCERVCKNPIFVIPTPPLSLRLYANDCPLYWVYQQYQPDWDASAVIVLSITLAIFLTLMAQVSI